MSLFPAPFLKRRLLSAPAHRRAVRVIATLLAGVLGMSGCEKVKNAVRGDLGNSDPQWQGDSSVLASRPPVLFRVSRQDTVTRIWPLATVGKQGFRGLGFSNRGWRAFDLAYLRGGSQLTPYREGRPLSAVATTRGMWDNGATPLDSMPGCSVPVPRAAGPVAADVWLLTDGPRSPLKPVASLGSSELAAALDAVPTLIAPTSGIAGSMLARYKREVHVVSAGTSETPSIIVIYNDPEALPDSVEIYGQRPRHLVVVLDKGVYGYRPTFTYTTVANNYSTPRYVFLDYFDVDDDGKGELFFGVNDKRAPATYTIVLRFENEAWRVALQLGVDCQSWS